MKLRKTVYVVTLFCAALFCVASCISVGYNKENRGNGELVTTEINISDYDAVKISGAATFNYQQMDTSPYLQFTIDENLLEHVDIYVSGKTLNISLQNKQGIGCSPTKYIINTNSRTLSNVKTSGSVDINLLSEVETDYLNFDLSGSASVNAGYPIVVNRLETNISGSGEVFVSGDAATCVLKISGSGKMIAPNLNAKHFDCKISGSGGVDIHVTEHIDCEISGSGSLIYSGNPSTVNQSVSGSGKLIKR